MIQLEAIRASMEALGGALPAPSLEPAYARADALRLPGLEPTTFAYEDAGGVFSHTFHLADVPGTRWRDVQSPYGYGGPVASGTDEKFLTRAWDAYGDWCRRRRVLVEFIRFHPLLENWRYYRGEVLEDRATVWVDLGTTDLLESYRRRCRQQVRKAYARGLRVAWEGGAAFLDAFLPLHEAMLERKGAGRSYRFPRAYYEAVAGLDSARRGLCYRGGEVVATGLFLLGREILEYHLGATSADGQECGGSPLLLHEAAMLGRDAGCRCLHLGGGTDDSPDNTLLFFKSGFSSRRASFKIGRFLHDPEGYHRLQSEWRQREGREPRHVLFYRA